MLTLADLRHPLPSSWRLDVGVDTGTYMSATFTVFPPDAIDAFVIAEFPNYRYVGGEIELLGASIPEWSRDVLDTYRRFRPGSSRLTAWCDENSQFKTELAHYGLVLRGNARKLELRVEIAREYMQHHRVWLAPWLSVLPYELEHAAWPDETSSAGRFERIKEDDHTLDTMEHVLSRRPRHKSMVREQSETFLARFLRLNRRHDHTGGADPHLGLH